MQRTHECFFIEEKGKTEMKIGRFIPVLIVMLLMGAMIAPMGGFAQDEQVELLVWDQFTGPQADLVDQIYADYNAVNPNVKIQREAFSTDQIRDTVNTALASGTGPDVIFYDSGPGYAGVLQEAALIQPLTDYAAQYGWSEMITASALKNASIDDVLYGMPLQVDLIGLFTNNTLIEEAGLTVPTTFDELIQFCADATEAGYIPMAFGDNPGWQAFHQFSMTVSDMMGPEALENLLYNNEGRWDSPEVIAAIQAFFVDLPAAGCFNEDVNAVEYNDQNGLFYAGDALMVPTGSWLASEINENMADYEVGMVPFPSLNGGMGQVFVSGVGSSYYISSATEHPDEAAAFIDYLFSPEVAKQWVVDAQYNMPMSVDVSGEEVTPLQQIIIDELDKGVKGEVQFGLNIDVLAPQDFNDTMSNGFQAILAGETTPEQLAADLQAAWDAGMGTSTP